MTERWRSQPETSRLRRRAARPGALLLEAMLALAIFVMAGSAVLALVSGSRQSMDRVALDRHAADLARSAMAKIEAGVESAQSLNGPVKPWSADPEGEIVFQVGGEDPSKRESGWELRIETERSQFTGLTKVSVTAWKRRGTGDEIAASYTLRQLVRLSGKGADEIGAQDELVEEAKRGVREQTQWPQSKGRGKQ